MGLVFTALLRTGETVYWEEVEDAMTDKSLRLVGFAYRDSTHRLKQRVAARRKEEVLVLGTSRSMQLREEFFTSDSFFNAGGGILCISETLPFLQSLPEDALPQRLLLVLDQYFYNEEWYEYNHSEEYSPGVYRLPDFSYAYRHVLWDWAEGKFSLLQALRTPDKTFGLASAGRGSGFRADGSYNYGTAPDAAADGTAPDFGETFLRIEQKTARFEAGDTPNAQSLEDTKALLAFCAEKGIAVTAFLPPYAPSVWQYMQETGEYAYIPAACAALQGIFEQYGFEVFDYSFLPETGDSMYVDGFHGSDRVYAAICLRLATDSTLFAGEFDAAALSALFEAPGNPLSVALPEQGGG